MDPVEAERINNAVADSLKYELWNTMVRRERELARERELEEQIVRAVYLEEKVDLEEALPSKKRRRQVSSHIGIVKKLVK